MARPTKIKMGWSKEREDGGEDCYTLTVLVTAGHPGSRDEPPDYGEVEVISVREDETGALRPDLIAEAQESIDGAEALERAEDAHEAAREAYEESREDARRERWAEERAERLNEAMLDIARR